MFLKPNLLVLSYNIPTIWFFLAAGLCLFVFAFWYESKKDGFGAFESLDLVILTILAIFPVYYFVGFLYKLLRIYFYRSFILNIDPFFIGILLLLLIHLGVFVLFSRFHKWSRFRLLDTYAIGLSHILFLFLLGNALVYDQKQNLIPAFLYLFINRFVFTQRSSKLLSGTSFSIFMLLNVLVITTFFRLSGHLLISVVLVTIGFVSFYFRRKSAMMPSDLPKEFIEFIKRKLHKKEKDINIQEKVLKEEDPYLKPGRDTDNAEAMDEAILEDSQKELIDNKLNMLKAIRLQIRRALAFIKIGKYGYCEICGKSIDKARLEVYPQATMCVEHAAQFGK